MTKECERWIQEHKREVAKKIMLMRERDQFVEMLGKDPFTTKASFKRRKERTLAVKEKLDSQTQCRTRPSLRPSTRARTGRAAPGHRRV